MYDYDPAFDQPCICDVCGGDVEADACVCEPCPVCGEAGNPHCYSEHGMVLTSLQKETLAKNEKVWADVREQERAMCADWIDDKLRTDKLLDSGR